MLSDDVTVLNIKHKVLQEVAKLAYDKKLEEGKELLPDDSGTKSKISLLYL